MQPRDPLAELQPLRLPAEPGWWPPAPGWWWLSGLLAVVLVLALLALWRRWRGKRYRRLALRAVERECELWRSHGDASQLLQGINRTLKAASLQAFPREEVAPLSGPSWLEFLRRTCPKNLDDLAPLGESGYVPKPELADPEALLAAARCWLTHHRRAG